MYLDYGELIRVKQLWEEAEKEWEILGKLYDLAWEAGDLELQDAMFVSLVRYRDILTRLLVHRPELVEDLKGRLEEEIRWLEQKIELGFTVGYDGLREDIKRLGKLNLQFWAVI